MAWFLVGAILKQPVSTEYQHFLEALTHTILSWSLMLPARPKVELGM
jgi:hypothetical protein